MALKFSLCIIPRIMGNRGDGSHDSTLHSSYTSFPNDKTPIFVFFSPKMRLARNHNEITFTYTMTLARATHLLLFHYSHYQLTNIWRFIHTLDPSSLALDTKTTASHTFLICLNFQGIDDISPIEFTRKHPVLHKITVITTVRAATNHSIRHHSRRYYFQVADSPCQYQSHRSLDH